MINVNYYFLLLFEQYCDERGESNLKRSVFVIVQFIDHKRYTSTSFMYILSPWRAIQVFSNGDGF